jgi:hypothetical protein
VPNLTFSRRDWLIGFAIIVLAFAFRMVIIMDRAHAPNAIAAFDPLPQGHDQFKYYLHIQEFREGLFPPDRYFYQPGMSWFLIASSRIIRTANLGALRVWTAALAALNCGLFVATTRLAFGRRWVGVIAGILFAIYPVGAFYDTDFVITAQTTMLLSLGLFGVLWLWRSPHNWTGAVLYGVSFGAIAVTRFEPIFLAPVFGLWLIGVRRDRRAVLQVALAAVLCVAVTLPIVVHNLSHGADYLITPVGQAEIYRGNNRDTAGNYGGGQASATTNFDYMHYLWVDIRLEPRRFVELELHKVGMYLSPDEPGNNLNYKESGEAVSPLLRSIPLDFRILLILSLFGFFALLREREPAAILLGAAFLVLMAAIMLIWVEARLRTPTIVFMIPMAAYGIVYAVGHFPVKRRAGTITVSYPDLRLFAVSAGIIVVVLVVAQFFYRDLPRPVTVDKLPDSAQHADAVYDQTLKLVGWKIEENYSRAGIIEPFHPYVVSLYWELIQPTTVDYGFAVALVIDGERVLGVDFPVGFISYPDRTTSTWKPGEIHVEHVGLAYNKFIGPVDISGDLLLSVYSDPAAAHLFPAEGVPAAPTHLLLAQPALIWGEGELPEMAAIPAAPVAFGKVLDLYGWTYPCVVTSGEPVDITLGWRTTHHPISRPNIFAVYILTETNAVAAQADSPPHAGRLLATSLPTGFAFGDTKQLTAPAEPGTYTLYTTVYDYDTGNRLSISGAPDNLLKLGTLQVVSSGAVTPNDTCYVR